MSLERKYTPEAVAQSEEVAAIERNALREAVKAGEEQLARLLPTSIDTVDLLMRESESDTVKLNAAKQIQALAGMEISRIDHSGALEFKPFKIS